VRLDQQMVPQLDEDPQFQDKNASQHDQQPDPTIWFAQIQHFGAKLRS